MPSVDTLVLTDKVHTLDPANPSAQAVAISDGRIAAVGSAADAARWKGAGTRVIDLGDATLTPGLVDGHMHPILGSEMADGVDLASVETPEQLRATLAAAARATERGGWVTGFGLDHNVFTRAAQPITAAAIDEALGDVPAILRLYDGHSALASSTALHRAGITGPREFAQRAAVVCDALGRPTGHLIEHAAIDLVLAQVPGRPVEQRRARLLSLLEDMAATGLTGGHVMDCHGDSLELLAALEDTAELPLRLRLAPWCMPGSTDEEVDHLIHLVRGHGPDRQSPARGRRWHVGAVKFFIDGTVEGGTAWLEHADCHGQSTDSFWLDPADYTRIVRRLAAAGVQTATHAIGDAAVRHVLDTLDGVETGGIRHRVEHLESIPRSQVERFAELGVIASMQPTHSAYTRADHTDEWSTRLGRARADRAWRCGDIQASGATLVLGSDWPIAHYDPRQVLAAAQLRRLPGHTAAPVTPHQAIDARAALNGMTSAPATAGGESDQAGRIAAGYRADLTAFSLDPLTTPPDEFADSPIRLTMIDGRVTHQA